MASLTMTNGLNLTVTFTGNGGNMLTESRLSTFVAALRKLHTAVPLTLFRAKETATPGEYSYKFTTADGRVWSQKIRIESTSSAMTFNVDDFWVLETEFVHHRDVRDLTIALVRQYGATLIEATF